jgi:hypothetical protein
MIIVVRYFDPQVEEFAIEVRRQGQPKLNRRCQSYCAASEDVTLEKVALSCVPRPLTTAMIATAMPAAMRPYSMAVAPDSSAMNWRNFAIMAASIGSGDEGFLKMACDKKEVPAKRAGASLS